MPLRVYTPPIFNLTANVWLNELPATLASWTGTVPARPPDISTACQLYFPRYALGRWLHALSESAFNTLLNSGVMELRYPWGTDIKAPWGVSELTDWSKIPLVEVPAGSARLYVACLQDYKHAGFPNQYVAALLAQVGPIPPAPPPPPLGELASGGASVIVGGVIPPSFDPRIATGAAQRLLTDPLAFLPQLASGGALEAVVTALRQLASGSAVTTLYEPPKAHYQLASGSGIETKQGSPTAPIGNLPSGAASRDQRLFPPASQLIGTGSGVVTSDVPPKASGQLPSGGAMNTAVGQNVFVAPCAVVGVPKTLTLTCVTQAGSISGWVGVSCTLTYVSGTTWTGTLTKGGNSGTITWTGNSASHYNFSGSSAGHWNIGLAVSDDSCTCGPPFSSTSGNHSTVEGINTGTTTWSVA